MELYIDDVYFVFHVMVKSLCADFLSRSVRICFRVSFLCYIMCPGTMRMSCLSVRRVHCTFVMSFTAIVLLHVAICYIGYQITSKHENSLPRNTVVLRIEIRWYRAIM